MKLNKLHAAIALAVGAAGFSGQAAALSLPVNGANTLQTFMSGASAQDSGILNMMRRICTNGTLDVYTNQTSTTASYPHVGNQALYLCTNSPNTNFGITGLSTAFSNVAVYKTSVGGSGNGVAPVDNSASLAFVNGTLAATSLCGTTVSTITVAATTDTSGNTILGSATIRLNCSGTANAIPDAGLSDVEPALLASNPTDRDNLTVKSANMVIFGIPVTLNLYRALQTAQGLPTDDKDTSAPSLSKLQIASVMNGAITDWTQLESPTGGALSFPGGTNTTVRLARRVSTSGTQTFAGIYFLNNPCFAGADNMLSTPTFANCAAPGTGVAFLGSSSQNVKDCLSTLNTNSQVGLGILSTEFPPAGTDGYRFVKINSRAPSLANVANAQYDYAAEQTVQYRSTTSALAGDKLLFVDQFIAKVGDPVVVSAIDGPLKFPISNASADFYNSGLMALFTNGYTPTDPASVGGLDNADMLANPVATFSKAVSGSPQNCATPQVIFPTSSSN